MSIHHRPRAARTALHLLSLSALSIGPATMLRAEVAMPMIFGDHMVLQQSIALPVWGKAAPGEHVTVTVGPRSGNAVADTTGTWKVLLEPLGQGAEAVTMTVRGTNTITFTDVLIGDVWACSGQSNMEYGINSTSRGKDDIPKAQHPQLRLFIVTKVPSFTPQGDLTPDRNPANTLIGHWQVCTPEILVGHGGWPDSFSATAYYFGTELLRTLKRPIGLIQCPWGGKPIEAFISKEALQADPMLAPYVKRHEDEAVQAPAVQAAYPAAKATYDAKMKEWNERCGNAWRKAMDAWRLQEAAALAAHAPTPPKPQPAVPAPAAPADGKAIPSTPTHLFNGMIHPIIPFGITGVIWYQGEANCDAPWDYDRLMAALIGDWRGRWGQGDFPFLFVQLASFQTPATKPVEVNGWPAVRDMQLRTLMKIPRTGMAVAIDIGEANDIHPRNKGDVGHRLALAARRIAYGEDLEWSGPLYQGMQTEGAAIRIRFTHATGLKAAAHPASIPGGATEAPPRELPGFAIAGPDRLWQPGKAVIDGETVVVSSERVKDPVAVRYGWAKNPPCYLYNDANLPASPFRTDAWPIYEAGGR